MKTNLIVQCLILLVSASHTPALGAKKKADQPKPPSPLETYERDALKQAEQQTPTPGSIWTPMAQFADLGRDLRASQVNDLVTIVVNESASAVSTGASETTRTSSVAASITGLAGAKSATSALANLANTSNATALKGDGTTSRTTSLTTTMSARVAKVLPNGYLVLEGSRNIQINSESQVITVRGVIRPADLARDNSVQSSRLAQMEVLLNGKGVVGDAIRRPNFLYRMLLGILPF